MRDMKASLPGRRPLSGSFHAVMGLVARISTEPAEPPDARAAAAAPASVPTGSLGAVWGRLAASLRTLDGRRRLAWALTVVLVLADVLVVGQHALVRHWAFHSYAFDLGNMDQAVWNTLHGHFFRFTNRGIDWYGPPTRLAIHVEPILLLIAPLYLIHPGASTLIVLQTVALAVGAVPLFALCLRRMPDLPLLGVAFVAAYLITPELLGEALFDFHPVTLATPLLLAAFYALDLRRYGWFLAAGVLAAACKEDVALALVPLGLLIALRRGRPRLGLAVAAGALAWTALCFLVIMPHFNGGTSSGGNAYWYRYTALGSSPASAVRHILTQPWTLVPVILSVPKLGYLALLLRTGGGLGLLAPLWLLAALPELAINLLSGQAPQFSGFYHYSAVILPTLMVAAVYGVAGLRQARLAALAGLPADAPASAAAPGALSARLNRLIHWWQGVIGRIPIAPQRIAPLAAAWLILTLGWNMVAIQPKLHGFWDGGSSFAPHQAAITALLSRIPTDATVAATDTLDPHLTDRETIYLLPDPAAYTAQYVAVSFVDVPAAWQQADVEMFSSMATSGRYRVLGVAGPVVVLQRVGPPLAGG
jgi:uncharacterized membrane protein